MILPPNGTSFALPSEEKTARVGVVISLPALTPQERLILGAAARTAIAGTREYGKGSIEAIASDGTVQRLGEDHLWIGFGFDPARGTEALSLLESILARPAFVAQTLETAAIPASARPDSLWDDLTAPPVSVYRTVTSAEARAVWTQYIAPSAMTIGFSGTGAEEFRRRWDGRKIVWPKQDDRYYSPKETLPSRPRIESATLALLAGKAGTASPATMLALVALGVGKGGLAWRVLRTEAGWSYRQEARLAGIPGGFEPRLQFDLPSAVTGEEARARLLAGVDALSQADLVRARAVLAATLRGEGLFPFSTDEPMGRLHLAIWWRAKTGTAFDIDTVISAAGNVELETLRETCRAFLAGATIRSR